MKARLIPYRDRMEQWMQAGMDPEQPETQASIDRARYAQRRERLRLLRDYAYDEAFYERQKAQFIADDPGFELFVQNYQDRFLAELQKVLGGYVRH